MEAALDVPLECQFPKDFGELDEEQDLLIGIGALDLVLIENAAELLRRVMMDGDNIEAILRELSRHNRGCAVLPSQTFPLWMDPKISKHISDKTSARNVIYHEFDSDDMFTDSKTYWHLIEPLKLMVDALKKEFRKSKENKCIFASFAAELDPTGANSAGHYAAFYWNSEGDDVMIFDSMQASHDGSSYTPFFRQLGVHIFGVKIVNSRAPECFSDLISLQITGGFAAGEPLMVTKSIEPLDLEQKALLHIQSTESQNHFCYMWSLWYLHHKMLGMDPVQSAKEIWENGMDPLVVIKRYIWSIFHLNLTDRKLVDRIPARYQKFFKYHFVEIWTNDQDRTLQVNFDFERCEIPVSIHKKINECLADSLRAVKLKMMPRTSKTVAVKKCKITHR